MSAVEPERVPDGKGFYGPSQPSGGAKPPLAQIATARQPSEPDELDLWPYPGDDAPIDDRINWELRRLSEEKARLDRLIGLKDREQARIDSWFANNAERPLSNIARHEENVKALMLAHSQKTVRVPFGTVTTRKGASVVEVDDKDAFIAWAHQWAPDLVRITRQEHVDLNAIKKAIGAYLDLAFPDQGEPAVSAVVYTDGEIVPGIRHVRKERSVTISVDQENEE